MEYKFAEQLLEFIFKECAGIDRYTILNTGKYDMLRIKEPLPTYDYILMAIKLLKEKFNITITDLQLQHINNIELDVSFEDTELRALSLWNIKTLPLLPITIERIGLRNTGNDLTNGHYNIYIQESRLVLKKEDKYIVNYQYKSSFAGDYRVVFTKEYDTKREAIDSINEHLTELYERVFYD